MNLKKSLLIAIALSLISLISWELYWRSNTDYYIAYLEDDRNLYAEERAKAETATSQDIILLGASRTGYNFNTWTWKEEMGIQPIHLTANGKPPKPFFKDIVNNTNFNGTLIIGVTPVAFFDIFGTDDRMRVANLWVDHYYNRTPAQKLGFILSKPLQRTFVFLTASEAKSYNDLDLKSLIGTISLSNRVPNSNFKLKNIGYNDEKRNLLMFPRLTDNKFYQKEITDEWDKVIPTLPIYEDIKDEIPRVFEEYKILIDKFKKRGGKIIFIRHKAEEGWNKYSKRMLPRDLVWDKFIEMSGCPGYHFEDYPFMSKYYLPDWSHLNMEDAKVYTRDMVNQLIKDGHLKKQLTKPH
ncbi:hypothetical protein [Mangrovimonas sp. ST2L15]|uniref:hypothetical protein n=1 Tax=Mangrovimonas sp. ST2L15 TaxID=1645916 RepID=UPI0006B52A2B|nr:hypothetical protein [Mangrovimonas sp. ST2L15]